jgi:chromosome segregation ATPase
LNWIKVRKCFNLETEVLDAKQEQIENLNLELNNINENVEKQTLQISDLTSANSEMTEKLRAMTEITMNCELIESENAQLNIQLQQKSAELANVKEDHERIHLKNLAFSDQALVLQNRISQEISKAEQIANELAEVRENELKLKMQLKTITGQSRQEQEQAHRMEIKLKNQINELEKQAASYRYLLNQVERTVAHGKIRIW